MSTDSPASPSHGLRHQVLGLFDCLAQSISTMAPTASAVMTIPLVFSSAGRGTWLAYLLATACTMIVGLCIARFARDSASPGSLYTYTTTSLNPTLRSIAAWALLMAYVACGASVVGGFIHYANVVLQTFFGTTWPVIPLGIACVALPVWVAYRDVKVSAQLMLYIEIVSVAMISVVLILLIAQRGIHVDMAQLSLKDVQPSGIRLGLILAMFSFVGFESATTLGHEVRDPLRTIPRAVLQSALISGLFFAVASYTEVMAWPQDGGSFADSTAPLGVLAKVAGVGFLGAGIDVCAMITMLSCTLACITASARVLFLMSHNGIAPRSMKEVHATNQTPHAAVLASGVATALLSIPLAAFHVSGETIYDWMGSLGTYGFIVVYALVAVALPIYLKRRGRLSAAAVALSVLAIAAMVLVLAGTLYPVPEPPKNWLPYYFLAYLVAGASWSAWMARRHQQSASLGVADAPARDISR
jgi:amino acid transporter